MDHCEFSLYNKNGIFFNPVPNNSETKILAIYSILLTGLFGI